MQAKVENGSIVLPSGMRYRLLVLPSYNADGQPVLHVEGNYVYTPSPLPKVETDDARVAAEDQGAGRGGGDGAGHAAAEVAEPGQFSRVRPRSDAAGR